jgi:hypothetical protein
MARAKHDLGDVNALRCIEGDEGDDSAFCARGIAGSLKLVTIANGTTALLFNLRLKRRGILPRGSLMHYSFAYAPRNIWSGMARSGVRSHLLGTRS